LSLVGAHRDEKTSGQFKHNYDFERIGFDGSRFPHISGVHINAILRSSAFALT
jgi:hypothetical protein